MRGRTVKSRDCALASDLVRALSSQQDAHVRAARNSDRSPRSHTYVASRKGARSASGMQSCWLDKLEPTGVVVKAWGGARQRNIGARGEYARILNLTCRAARLL